MTEITLVIGSEARGADGLLGEVRALVVDPAARTVTHLMVEPDGRSGLARLVPLDAVDAPAGELRLRCTQAEFRDLPPAEEMLAEFVPGYEAPVQVLVPGWRDAGGQVVEGSTIPRMPTSETIDLVPGGEVAEHRGDRVHATDGEIGEVRALRIDAGSGQVTHVLLKEGHLWARKQVAIPAANVTGFAGGIRLNITKQQVGGLPPDS